MFCASVKKNRMTSPQIGPFACCFRECVKWRWFEEAQPSVSLTFRPLWWKFYRKVFHLPALGQPTRMPFDGHTRWPFGMLIICFFSRSPAAINLFRVGFLPRKQNMLVEASSSIKSTTHTSTCRQALKAETHPNFSPYYLKQFQLLPESDSTSPFKSSTDVKRHRKTYTSKITNVKLH